MTNSAQLLVDSNKTLWSSWVVQHEEALGSGSMPTHGAWHDSFGVAMAPGRLHDVKVSSVFHDG